LPGDIARGHGEGFRSGRWSSTRHCDICCRPPQSIRHRPLGRWRHGFCYACNISGGFCRRHFRFPPHRLARRVSDSSPEGGRRALGRHGAMNPADRVSDSRAAWTVMHRPWPHSKCRQRMGRGRFRESAIL
jgi:hypothetical protein